MSQPVLSPGSEGRSKPNRASSRSVRCDRSRRLRADSAGPSSLRDAPPSAATPGAAVVVTIATPSPDPSSPRPFGIGVAAAARLRSPRAPPPPHPGHRRGRNLARWRPVPARTARPRPRRGEQHQSERAPSRLQPITARPAHGAPRPWRARPLARLLLPSLAVPLVQRRAFPFPARQQQRCSLAKGLSRQKVLPPASVGALEPGRGWL